MGNVAQTAEVEAQAKVKVNVNVEIKVGKEFKNMCSPLVLF
jgi:hypothetical protein